MPDHCRQVFTCCRWLCRSDTCTVPCRRAVPSPACGAVDPESSSALLWDLGLSRCAELPPPLEGVALHRILCFHGNGKTGSLSVIGCAGSEAVAGLHPSGDPCCVPWQQPRLHYTTASRARIIPWDVPGQPAARRSSWNVQGRQFCWRLDQVVPSSWTRFPGEITCTFRVPSPFSWGEKCI